MKATIFLKIASVLTFVHGLLHTIGGVFGAPAPGVMSDAVTVMKTYRFDVLGVNRTFWDFHMGEGLALTLNFLVQTILLWQLAGLAKSDPGRARPMIAVFAFSFAAFAVLSWKYFFAGPVVMEIIIALVLIAAYLLANQPRPATD
jgi:hypothetical protein